MTDRQSGMVKKIPDWIRNWRKKMTSPPGRPEEGGPVRFWAQPTPDAGPQDAVQGLAGGAIAEG
jgi:hypothetical protein